MKKKLLKIISLVICICIFLSQISAQAIPNPGEDPLDSAVTIKTALTDSVKSTAFKSKIITKETQHQKISLDKSLVFVNERFEVQKRKK